MPSDSSMVGRSAVVGGTWTVGARLISRAIDLCTMVILAHLLRPSDFGLVAIAMTVIFIVEAALEMPLSQALVRLKHPVADHYDTAFTLGLLRGLLLGMILCLTAIPFAHFYADRRLFPLICVLSLAPASRGLVSPRLADFSRRFDFAPDFLMEFVGKLVAFSVALTLALLTRSYWAIAAGTVISPTVATIVSYIVAPYRPRLSLKSLSAFSGFLGWITAAQVISAVNWQADRLILGKLTSRTEMGLFTAANDTANIPLMAFLSPLMRPLLSAFSVTCENNERLVNSYQLSATAIVSLGLPLLIGESLLAGAGTRLFLGSSWAGSAVLLKWLAFSIIPTLFAAPIAPLVMALGRTQIFLKRNLFELCIKMPLVIVGAIKFGFFGIIAARGISEIASVFYAMAVVRRLTGLPITKQLTNPWRSVVSSLALAAVLSLIAPQLVHLTGVSLALGPLLAIGTGVAVYVGSLLALWYGSNCPPGIEMMATDRWTSLLKHRHTTTEAA